MDGDEPCKRLHPSCGGRFERPSNPECSSVLHPGHVGHQNLRLGGPMKPELEAVCGHWDHTRPIEEVPLHGSKTAHRVSKHPHSPNSGHSLGGIVSDVLLEKKLPVEIEAQVPPVLFGLQGGTSFG